jgi:hypothetical protein
MPYQTLNLYYIFIKLNLIIDGALTAIFVTEKANVLERVPLLILSLHIILSNIRFS